MSAAQVENRSATALRLGQPAPGSLPQLLRELGTRFEVVLTDPQYYLFWRSVVPDDVHVVTSQRELQMLAVRRVVDVEELASAGVL